MLVNLFHGYSHLVNGVVFSCNMFPGHLIGLYCYGYKLYWNGQLVWTPALGLYL